MNKPNRHFNVEDMFSSQIYSVINAINAIKNSWLLTNLNKRVRSVICLSIKEQILKSLNMLSPT